MSDAKHEENLSTEILASALTEEVTAKFAPDGSPRPFPGTTVVCHLRDDGPASNIHRVIVDNCFDNNNNNNTVGSELLRRNYVRLPAPSLHMTLLDIVVYHNTKIAGVSTRAMDTDHVRTDELVRYRRAFLDVQSEIRKNVPIKMTIDLDASRYPTVKQPLTVPLKPYDENEANKLRALRRTIGSAFAMPAVKLDFHYHVTVYYPLRVLSAEQFAVLRQDWSEAISRIAETMPTFEIEQVELCEFEDMFFFKVVESVS